MAFGFKSEEEAQEYLEKLGIEYKFSCFKEKDPEGCHLLGDYLEAVKKDFESAVKVFKSNCDERNYAKSCFKFGNFSYLGKGCESNNLLAFDYYKKACDLDHPDGCLHVGVMLTSKEKSPGKDTTEIKLDFPNGVKALEKACAGGNVMGCFFASSLYITGAEGVPKDRKKASELSLTACNGGNIYACMNLSRMYKNGDGVEKDEAKANVFKEKAREIRDDMRKKQSIGLQQHT
ncbi:Cytochrome c oxidase assembly factor 7 like protein [Argiope bruennichi]|uniref:Cytochrome c oxidase assembly factor 7 like protein n=1 Tax=Argiope bruennichi TaxID=94029 RepID=A0A8T0EQQ3_ARGBR|nr:Cytochrome c oxidase assembly factor 7 like protein [Argiope bruennichi]